MPDEKPQIPERPPRDRGSTEHKSSDQGEIRIQRKEQTAVKVIRKE